MQLREQFQHLLFYTKIFFFIYGVFLKVYMKIYSFIHLNNFLICSVIAPQVVFQYRLH